MKKKVNLARRGRRIVVDGVHWAYDVGSSHIVAYSATGERKLEKIWVVKGIDVYEFDRMRAKRCLAVIPQEVKNWLSNANN